MISKKRFLLLSFAVGILCVSCELIGNKVPPLHTGNLENAANNRDYAKVSTDKFDTTTIQDYDLKKTVTTTDVSPPIMQEPAVKHLKIINTTANSLTISWNLFGNVTGYELLINNTIDTNFKKELTFSSELTEYTITGLDGCTKYSIFLIPIVLEDDPSENSKYIKEIEGETGVAATSEIEDLEVYATTDSNDDISVNVYVKWKPPKKNRNCLDHYVIKKCFLNSNEMKCDEPKRASIPQYNESNLEPCIEYTFSVYTITHNGEESNSSIIQEKYTSFDPKPPLALKAEVVENGDEPVLNVTWNPPKVATACIDYYYISLKNHNTNNTMEYRSNKTYLEPKGMRLCAAYDVNVRAVMVKEDDTERMSKAARTNYTWTVEAPVQNENAIWSEKNNLTISWRMKNIRNCSYLLIATNCVYTELKGYGYKPVNGSSIYNITGSLDVVVNATVPDLSPFTTYNCTARVIATDTPNSPLSEIVTVTTAEDVPSPPSIVVSNVTSTEYTFEWLEPLYIPGEIIDYEIALTWKPLFPVPNWCDLPTSDNVTLFDGSVLSMVYAKGMSYSNYSVRIRAKTGAGWGNYSEPVEFISNISAPSRVTNLTYAIKTNLNDTNIMNTILQWGLPCPLNGELEYFNISVFGTRPGFKGHTFTKIINVMENSNKDDMFYVDFGELKAHYHYIFKVAAKVVGVAALGATVTYDADVEYPAGIPAQPDEQYVRSIMIDPQKARRTMTTAAVLLPLFPSTNGDIKYYAVMVAEMGHNSAVRSRFNVNEDTWPKVPSWEDSMLQDFQIPYQATEPKWDPYPKYVVNYGNLKAVKFVVGEDTTCKEVSMNTEGRLYCNGPLKPDTWYHVRMRAYTDGGYADSVAFVVKTNAGLNVTVVVCAVFGIMLLGIFTTMMLLMRRRNIQAVLQRFLHSSMPGSPVPTPFTRKKFLAHCQQLADNPGKLSNEFQLLQTLSMDLQMPTNAACLQANRKKNRYSDILPYDFSRVKLNVIDNDPNTDYINASFIKGFSGEDEYIACQGPKEETTYDFWRMVDQYDVKIIIMLTQLVERGKEKCHQYFPTIRETFTYEKMSIRCTSELDYRTCMQRTLILEKENTKRNIIHLQFKDWPDHDVPEDFDQVINFCQIMRRQINLNKGLVVIHCSAGIGRTGTLIAIDILLQQIRDNRKLDVFGTVYRLRRHRLNMVQRESQYAYIYNCIRQVLKNPYFLKSYKPPPVLPTDCNHAKKKTEASNSELDLASSIETMSRNSLSTSGDSMKPLCDTSTNSTVIFQKETTPNGLRYCKSTSDITTKPYKKTVKFGSFNFPISELLSTSESNDSINEKHLNGSTDSLYENVTPLLRSKSTHILHNTYTFGNQDMLERDTSL